MEELHSWILNCPVHVRKQNGLHLVYLGQIMIEIV